jgi:Tfp pilus assembly protein PilN
MLGHEKYQWLQACVGIELHILSDGETSCRMCDISLDNNSLSINSKFEVTGDLLDILKKIPVEKPISVTLTGKGVLTKKTSKEEELSDDKLLRLFPNINPGQFHIQNFISGDFSFISIIRKEVLDGILKTFEKRDLKILLVNLGPFASSNILKQINSYGTEIRFDGHLIILSEAGAWNDYKHSALTKSPFPLKIGIEPIPEQYLLAYAAAFQLALYHKLNAVVLPVDAVVKSLDDFEQKQKFNFRFAAVLGVFFVLLMVNFLIFSYYSSKNNVLLAEVSQSTASVETIQQTENDIKKSEALLKELGWYKGISHAWLADQLGQSLPADIKLREVAINPLNTIETDRQRLEIYKFGTIEIKGEAKNLEPVNEWIYLLKNKTWLQKINLDSFSPSTENETQIFSITINF